MNIKTIIMTLEIHILGLELSQRCGWYKSVNSIPTLLLVRNPTIMWLQHNFSNITVITYIKVPVIIVYNKRCCNYIQVHTSHYLYLARARVVQWVRELDYLTTHTSLSPIRRGFAPGFVTYKKGCTRLAAASDKVYQLLAHGRWFSPGTPASSTTKTSRNDVAEI